MLVGMSNPPAGLASGKLDTPCERMQSAYLTPGANGPDAAEVLLDCDAPHAAIPTAHAMAASEVNGRLAIAWF
jgi:hypothetical protein